MARFIKDTDFLPNAKDVSKDVFELLYGVVKLRVETRIYDAITLLCRRYPDAPLRNAKISAWKSAIKKVIEKLECLRGEEQEQVYIPYFELLCSIDRLINLYSFAEGVLIEMNSLSVIPPYRKGMSNEKVQLFFPFGNLVDVMRKFGKKCAETGLYDDCVEIAIEKELEDRGLIESSTLESDKTYDDIFFGGVNLPKHTVSIEEESVESDSEDDKIVRAGFLYYALEDFYKKIINNRGLYKSSESTAAMKTAVCLATYRIASGLFEPDKPIKGGNETTSKRVFYTYANGFRNGKPLSEDSKKRIETLLDDFISKKKG